jgi:phosphomethylpyrimidine synthase
MKYDLSNLCYVEEVKKGYITVEQATARINNNDGLSFIDNGNNSKLLGQSKNGSALVKVASNTGISHKNQLDDELRKLDKLISLPYAPDMIFDHTCRGVLAEMKLDEHLYARITKEYGHKVVVATAPVMVAFREGKGIDISELIEIIEHMAMCGVRFMLFHPTTTRETWKIAEQSRIKPSTSWTGNLLYDDILFNNRETNIIAENFDLIMGILKKYNVTCDIGTTFRPARIKEALDSAHTKELLEQEVWIKKVKDAGVFCVREGIGHIPLHKVDAFSTIINHSTPMMPLPVSTDFAVGFDHVSCAVAMTAVGMLCNIGLLNPVTDIEHTGGIPTYEDTLLALKTARIVAHSLDLKNCPKVQLYDDKLADARQNNRTCVVKGGLFNEGNESEISSQIGCSRCGNCPFVSLENIKGYKL